MIPPYALTLLLLVTAPVVGQSPRSTQSLTGSVRDANGGVLPGAIVAVIDETTRKVIETTVTGPDGTFVLSPVRAVVEVNGWARRDRVEYNGSGNLFADQPATLAQRRSLTNAGGKLTMTYAAGGQTIKAGLQRTTTWLAERFQTGLTDPAFNTPCFTPGGDPSPDTTLRDPHDCAERRLTSNSDSLPALLPYDLTRGGALFAFEGSGRIAQWAAGCRTRCRWGTGARWPVLASMSTTD